MVGILVIGGGRMGRIHAISVKSLSGELLGIVDINEAAKALAQELHVPYFSNVDAAFSLLKDKIDAAIIATATTTHFEMIRQSIEHGLDIFVEKPIGINRTEAEEVVKLVHNNGTKLQVGFHKRFDADFVKFKKIMEQGDLGQPLMVRFVARDPITPQPPAGIFTGEAGAIFYDFVIHDLDMSNWLFGLPDTVYSDGGVFICRQYGEVNDLDTVIVELKYKGGPLVIIETSRCSSYGYDVRAEALMSGGMIGMRDYLSDNVFTISNSVIRTAARPWFAERFGQAYRSEIEAFMHSLSTGEKPAPNELDGFKANILAEVAARSFINREPITVNEAL
ncbi:MAG: Gfo/Idh/MocA family oxidoreductase [Thermocladium sp.]